MLRSGKHFTIKDEYGISIYKTEKQLLDGSSGSLKLARKLIHIPNLKAVERATTRLVNRNA